jgi:predicted  nucleic acid-binding Zn-ribbon protein
MDKTLLKLELDSIAIDDKINELEQACIKNIKNTDVYLKLRSDIRILSVKKNAIETKLQNLREGKPILGETMPTKFLGADLSWIINNL